MQKLLDTTLADAISLGYDTVQLKPKGVSRQFGIAGGVMTAYSRFQLSPEDSHPVTGKVNCTLLGASLLQPARFYVYDCWLVERDGELTDLRAEPYRSRHVAAKIQCQLLGEPFKLVQNYPITFAKNLWSTLSSTTDFNGLIFRKSKEDSFQPIRAARWYAEMPKELV